MQISVSVMEEEQDDYTAKFVRPPLATPLDWELTSSEPLDLDRDWELHDEIQPSASKEVPGYVAGTKDTRRQLCFEVITTERSYVKTLDLICTCFLYRLEAYLEIDGYTPLLSRAQIGALFFNLKNVYELNAIFLADLEEILKSGEEIVSGVARVFVKYAQFFKIYKLYTRAFDSFDKVLQALTKDSKEFKLFLQVSEYCAKSTLQGLMITPVQRVPRYLLLLQQILKQTAEHAPEYAALRQAHDSIESLATYINDSMKMADAQEKVLTIQRKLFRDQVQLVKPGRICVMHGKLTKLYSHSKFKMSKGKSYLFILFSDILLYAALPAASTTWELKHILPVFAMTVEDIPDTKEQKHAFRITSTRKSFIVLGKSQEAKEVWIKVLNRTIDSCNRSFFTFESGKQKTTRDLLGTDQGSEPTPASELLSPQCFSDEQVHMNVHFGLPSS